MTYRCANPQCRFDYVSMRGICAEPTCLKQSQPGCGCYYRFAPDGKPEKLPAPDVPPPDREDIAWLCCYCATQLVVRGTSCRIALIRWASLGCIRHAEARCPRGRIVN
jgi:hypothetical protein